jgi:hypothetical protein
MRIYVLRGSKSRPSSLSKLDEFRRCSLSYTRHKDYGKLFRGGLVIASILKQHANWLRSNRFVLLAVHWQVA